MPPAARQLSRLKVEALEAAAEAHLGLSEALEAASARAEEYEHQWIKSLQMLDREDQNKSRLLEYVNVSVSVCQMLDRGDQKMSRLLECVDVSVSVCQSIMPEKAAGVGKHERICLAV
jgi:hypothetical protein